MSQSAVGYSLRGPENLGSAPGLAIVGEHSGAFGMTLGNARGVLPSARRAIRIRPILEHSRALPGFWGPRRALPGRDNEQKSLHLERRVLTGWYRVLHNEAASHRGK
ncbi:hypothetical protein RHS03_00053, partial [Rhizoctonia solani]